MGKYKFGDKWPEDQKYGKGNFFALRPRLNLNCAAHCVSHVEVGTEMRYYSKRLND